MQKWKTELISQTVQPKMISFESKPSFWPKVADLKGAHHQTCTQDRSGQILQRKSKNTKNNKQAHRDKELIRGLVTPKGALLPRWGANKEPGLFQP